MSCACGRMENFPSRKTMCSFPWKTPSPVSHGSWCQGKGNGSWAWMWLGWAQTARPWRYATGLSSSISRSTPSRTSCRRWAASCKSLCRPAPPRQAAADAQGRLLRDYLWLEMARWLRDDAPRHDARHPATPPVPCASRAAPWALDEPSAWGGPCRTPSAWDAGQEVAQAAVVVVGCPDQPAPCRDPLAWAWDTRRP